jgi:hypothetical protein
MEENFMNINLKEDIKPISYIKTNAADMVNALSMLKLLQVSEKAVQAGKVYDNMGQDTQ